jgi:methionyl-tRNA formyltransferase
MLWFLPSLLQQPYLVSPLECHVMQEFHLNPYSSGLQVAAVVTQPGRRRGRSKGPSPSPVAAAAAARGIPDDLVLTPEKARDVSSDAGIANMMQLHCLLCTSPSRVLL